MPASAHAAQPELSFMYFPQDYRWSLLEDGVTVQSGTARLPAVAPQSAVDLDVAGLVREVRQVGEPEPASTG